MKKTLIILLVVALLGILAATLKPSPQSTTTTSASAVSPTKTAATNITAAVVTPSATTATTSTTTTGQYKDGSYTGTTSSNSYDDIQVAIVISGGKITTITTPTLRGDSGHSTQINNYAVPQLKNQALAAQSASIDGVSGASYTTEAYVNSLQSALDQAKA